MTTYSKGVNTRKLLLKTSRKLFYEQGYDATTTRQIAQQCDINLGLIKYHFQSKANIAQEIYLAIRSYFDNWFVDLHKYPQNQVILMTSAIDFILCFNSPSFKRFYTEIYREPKIHELFQSKVSTFEHTQPADDIFFTLHGVAFSYVKPSLIAFSDTEKGQEIPKDQYILFYMTQQMNAYHLSDDPLFPEKALAELKKYFINVVDNFTPVIAPISE